LVQFKENLDGGPAHNSGDDRILNKVPVYIAHLEHRVEEYNTHNIESHGTQHTNHHNLLHFYNREDDIEHLKTDQGRESDCHDVDKTIRKQGDCHKHDHGCLENGDPHPNQKGFHVHLPSQLKGFVERGVLHAVIEVHILVRND
jgi:hypothetical protein